MFLAKLDSKYADSADDPLFKRYDYIKAAEECLLDDSVCPESSPICAWYDNTGTNINICIVQSLCGTEITATRRTTTLNEDGASV